MLHFLGSFMVIQFETKWLLFIHFDIKDLGDASHVLGIQILHERTNDILRLSQSTYFDHISKKFNMQSCSSVKTSIVKGDKFSKNQCPHNENERNQMKAILYASLVGSLMFDKVYTRHDVTFVVSVLNKYLSDIGQNHWKAAKRVLRYLQGNKDLMLIYRCTYTLEVVGFSDSTRLYE